MSKTDQKLDLSSSLASCLKDPRDPAKTLYSLGEIIGFRGTMIATGYEDGNELLIGMQGSPIFNAQFGPNAGRKGSWGEPPPGQPDLLDAN